VRLRVAEVGEDAVTQVLRDMPTDALDGTGGCALVRAHDLAQVLGVERRPQLGRADEVAEQDGELPALARGGAGVGACGYPGVRCRRARPALQAELRIRWELGSTLRALPHQCDVTLETELRARRIVVTAGGTHLAIPRTGWYGGRMASGKFVVEIEREDDGRWIAEVVALPGVMAYGSTREDALAKAEVVALRVLADRLEHGEAIPQVTDLFEAA
jgi:predicted RNase H-like HicB family nuclease